MSFGYFRKSDYKVRRCYPFIRLSTSNNSTPIGRIIKEIRYLRTFKKLWKKLLACLSLIKMTVTIHKDKRKFMTTSRRILLRTRNVTEIVCRQN